MKKMSFTALLAASAILAAAHSAASAANETLAVVAFKTRGIEDGENIGRIAAELASVKMGAWFRVLERVQIDKVLESRDFEGIDLVEQPARAAQAGKLAKAQFILVGSLNKIGSDFIIVAKIISCDTGEQYKAGSAMFKSLSEISAAVESLVTSMGLGSGDDLLKPPSQLPEGISRVRPGVFKSEKDGALMVWIPPGKFYMGSEGLGEAEKPVHEVKLKGFFMDRDEATNKLFARFLNFRAKDTDDAGNVLVFADEESGIFKRGDTWSPARGFEDHPVVRVTWFGAAAYAKWAGKSLPTEAQWEYSAAGRDERKYPWGNGEPSAAFARFGKRSPERAVKAGSILDGASQFGVRDMAGNVAEWCMDWFDPTYYEACPESDPVNSDESGYKVLRGGSWYDGKEKLHLALRVKVKPSFTDDTVGFRCVKILD